MKPSPAALVSCCALLGACATGHSLVPGVATEAEVRAAMGTPGDVHARNGDRILEYARGAEGFHTYMVRLGPDGKMKQVTQVLTEEQLARIVPGRTTLAEVRQLLGRPSFENDYGVGPTWSWRFKRGDVHPGHLVVTFNSDGTVSNTIAIVDSPRGP
jgi:hypothetical protein